MDRNKKKIYPERARRKYNAHKGNPKKKRKKKERRQKKFRIPLI